MTLEQAQAALAELTANARGIVEYAWWDPFFVQRCVRCKALERVRLGDDETLHAALRAFQAAHAHVDAGG